MKFNKWIKENKNLLIIIGILVLTIISIWYLFETSKNNKIGAGESLVPINYSNYNYSLLNISCYENYIKIDWEISADDEIIGYANLEVNNLSGNYVGLISFDMSRAARDEVITSTAFSLIKGENYNISVKIGSNIKSINCVTQGK